MDDLELELNKNDASIDTTQIPNYRRNIKRSIAGLLTFFTLFSGSVVGPTIANAAEESPSYSTSQSYDSEDLDKVVEIPEAYQNEVAYMCKKEVGEPITVGDLRNVNESYLSLIVLNDYSLEWLNYLSGVDSLDLIVRREDTKVFREIKKLSGITNLGISTYYKSLDLTSEDFSFLSESTDITSLRLYGYNIEPGLLEGLTHLKKLSLMTDGNYETDFTKLTFLDELDFSLADPYDVAIDLTKKEYDILKDAGVNITFDSQEELATYIKVNEKLEKIIAELGVDEKSSDTEKLNAILVYVLENLTYDQEIKYLVDNNLDYTEAAKLFYQGGALYGALEMDTAICGNYAALTNALAERLGLDTYYLTSSNHAWSLVEVEGEQYYVDSTWLDGSGLRIEEEVSGYTPDGHYYEGINSRVIPAEDAIKTGQTEGLNWYMEDPTNYPDSTSNPESHEVENLPSFIQLKPIKNNNLQVQTQTETYTEETTSKEQESVIRETESIVDKEEPIKITEEDEFELTIGNKKWIIGGAVAVGVLAGLGGAVAINKKKKEEERRRRIRRQNELTDMTRYDSFGGSYGSIYGSSSFETYNSDYSSSYDIYGNPTNPSSKGKSGRRTRF